MNAYGAYSLPALCIMFHLRPSFITPPILLCNSPSPPVESWKYTTYLADDFPVDIDTASQLVHTSPFLSFCPWPVTSTTPTLPVMLSDIHLQYALVSTMGIIVWFMLGALVMGRRG